MGYLVDTSQTLTFDQVKPLVKYIKHHGIIQFLLLYKKFKDLQQNKIYWGDETELHIINIDPQTKRPKLQLNTDYIFESLTSEIFSLQPEYGGWMVEAVPTSPYEFTGDPNIIIENFKTRREVIKSICRQGDTVFAGTAFPLLNVGDFYISRPSERESSFINNGEESDDVEERKISSDQEMFSQKAPLINELLNPHPRYHAMCENIKQRRQGNVCILIPIYPDERTSTEKTPDEPYPGFIYMDETLYGTGNTSLQLTFGTKNLEDARYLTDQLAVFSSIMLPLSAASAVFKGKIADVDVRWNVLLNSVDTRTPEERDPNHPNYLSRTRWAPISRYISDRPQCKDEYNDVYFPPDREMTEFARQQARELGIDIDERLIDHLGFLFLQEPIIVFSDKIYVDDSKTTNHFENIQSTNWNNVRFKPPPSFESEVGWRVELRPIEAQLTIEESAAFAMLSYFFVDMVMKREYNFYIPISKLDENILRAQKRDAVLTEKFWFRKEIEKESPNEFIELTIDEILHGKKDIFIGLFNLIFKFCFEEYGVDIQTEWAMKKDNSEFPINKLTENMKYFEILSRRAKGETPTIAKWMRSFVLKHPLYNRDSIVTKEIAADLISAMVAISDGEKSYQDFI